MVALSLAVVAHVSPRTREHFVRKELDLALCNQLLQASDCGAYEWSAVGDDALRCFGTILLHLNPEQIEELFTQACAAQLRRTCEQIVEGLEVWQGDFTDDRGFQCLLERWDLLDVRADRVRVSLERVLGNSVCIECCGHGLRGPVVVLIPR